MSSISVDTALSLTASDLRSGISDGGLYLQYQPIIHLPTQKIIGLESLMRWNHRTHGTIPPSVFLPLAHSAGAQVDLSLFALTQSCRTLRKLQTMVGLDPDLFVSVNFTSDDFADENFIDHIYMALSQTDLHPRKLRLELLENVLLNDQCNAIQTLSLCRQTGMGITVDNYGTSREFAESLHLYPVDTVKIAPSLVRSILTNRDAYDRVAALAAHARNLDITVSAVGIEKIEQAQALFDMGCDLAQGYLFAPPLEESGLLPLFQPDRKTATYA